MKKFLGFVLLVAAGGGCLYWAYKPIRPEAVVATPDRRLKVLASFSILGDVVRNIGRDRIDVDVIVGPDADPHVYRPTPQTVQQVAAADLIIINGLGFEGWLERLIQASGYQGEVVIACEGIAPQMLPHQDGKVLRDPHAWNSVENMLQYVYNITTALQRRDPENAAVYGKYSAYYCDQLKVLEAWIHQQVARVPADQRKVITAHDAFQYLGLAYGIAFFAPVGITTEEEPSAKGAAILIDQIKRQKIRALFLENAANGKLLSMISQEVQIPVSGVLYADALSQAQGPAPNYIAMMRYNITQLVQGMLG